MPFAAAVQPLTHGCLCRSPVAPWQTPQGSDPLNYSATRLVSQAQAPQKPAAAAPPGSSEAPMLSEVTERLPGLSLTDGQAAKSGASAQQQQQQQEQPSVPAEQAGSDAGSRDQAGQSAHDQPGDGSRAGQEASSQAPPSQLSGPGRAAAAMRTNSNGDPEELSSVARLLEVCAPCAMTASWADVCLRVCAAVKETFQWCLVARMPAGTLLHILAG